MSVSRCQIMVPRRDGVGESEASNNGTRSSRSGCSDARTSILLQSCSATDAPSQPTLLDYLALVNLDNSYDTPRLHFNTHTTL